MNWFRRNRRANSSGTSSSSGVSVWKSLGRRVQSKLGGTLGRQLAVGCCLLFKIGLERGIGFFRSHPLKFEGVLQILSNKFHGSLSFSDRPSAGSSVDGRLFPIEPVLFHGQSEPCSFHSFEPLVSRFVLCGLPQLHAVIGVWRECRTP
jgi:hypothetical protein